MKKKEQTRRRLRKEFQAKQIDIAAPGDENKPKWKVVVYSLACDINTVYAEDRNDAVKKLEEGFGRHVGVEGPTVVGMACAPADSPHGSNFIAKWMGSMAQMQREATGQGDKVVVPKLVVAKS